VSNGSDPPDPDRSVVNWYVHGLGECWQYRQCWPEFFTPQTIVASGSGVAIFEERVRSYRVVGYLAYPVPNPTCDPIDDNVDSTILECPPSSSECSTALISRCFTFGGDFDFFTCTCIGCDTCGGSPILLDIIEAMKLMNEIQAETAGEVVKIYVENGQPVEYGQPLFGIKR
jgi:hypothetical protein